MIEQWTNRQIHDTVAAIAREHAFAGAGQSIASRFFRYLLDRIQDLFELARGSLDARLIVYAAIGAILLIIVARIFADRRLAEQRARRAPGRVGRERRDYWARARELAEQARYADAVHALYAAILESLTVAAAVRFHASKTGGDYARELRARGSPVASEFRAFIRDYDRTMYGTTDVSSDDYTRLMSLAERVMRGARAGVAA